MSASECIAYLLASAFVLKCRHIVGSRVKAVVAAGRANVKACSKKLQSMDDGAEWWNRSQDSASTSGMTMALNSMHETEGIP